MTPHPRSRAFAVSSLAVLLLVVVIALLLWRACLIYQGASASSANVAGNSQVMGYLIGNFFGSLALCVGITAAIGVAAYFTFGKSQNAANGAMDVVLLLAILIYGFQIYAWFNSSRYAAIQKGQPGSGAVAGGPSIAGSGGDPLVDRMKAADKRTKEQMEAAAKRSEEQMEAQRKATAEREHRMREQMERARQGLPPLPPQPTPAPIQPSPGNPATTTPGSTPNPMPRAPAVNEDPKVTSALAAVRKDADGRVDPVASLADELLLACRKAPEASFSAIDDRLKKLKSLRQSSTDLGRWLRDFDKATDKALADAGLDPSTAMGPRIRFTGDYRASSRAMVCDQLNRFCDDAIEEAELLRGKIGKWRLGGDGKIDTKDRDLESKARTLRMRMDFTTDQRVRMVDQLNGR